MVRRIYTDNESIEIRRVITSGNSFVLSIPKDWLDVNELKQGDELECRITKNKIVILNKRVDSGNKHNS